MTHQRPRLLLIGCGKMGSALAQGWIESNLNPHLLAVDRSAPSENKTYPLIHSIEEIDENFIADIIIIAVKPNYAETTIQTLRTTLKDRFRHAALLSVMAGKSCASLAKATENENFPIIRAMPNTPSSIGAGVTGLYYSPSVDDKQKELVQKLMSASGEIVIVPKEKDLQIVTAISGSGPAYIFLLAELLEENGVKMGLERKIAKILARQMIYGAGKMLHILPEEAAQLRKNVTSPNGTTQAALNILMHQDALPKHIAQALQAAAHHAQELDN